MSEPLAMPRRVVLCRPTQTSKHTALTAQMHAAHLRGEHAHYVGRAGEQGVNCPQGCRKAGITEWTE